MTEAAHIGRLRPVREADLDRLDAMFADPEAIGVFNWGGYTDRSRVAAPVRGEPAAQPTTRAS